MESTDVLQEKLRVCAEEQIKFAERVQPFAAILAGRMASEKICVASANAPQFLKRPVTQIVGADIGCFFPDFTEKWFENTTAGYSRSFQIHRDASDASTGDIHLHAHSHSDRWVIQIEAACSSENCPSVWSLESRALAATTGLDEALERACEILRSLLGYDRVMAYKFLPNWDGYVAAEACKPGHQLYKGLHFPASDIPPQARDLYVTDHLRIIPDITQDHYPLIYADDPDGMYPLDMTGLSARAVSSVHLQYLRNMRVGATFVLSLVIQDRLWGLLACHHKTPRFIGPLDRDAALIFADFCSQHIAALLAREESIRRVTLHQAALEVGSSLDVSKQSDDRVLTTTFEKLCEPLKACGAAILTDEKIVEAAGCAEKLPLEVLRAYLTSLRGNHSFMWESSEQIKNVTGIEDWPDFAPGILAVNMIPDSASRWLVFIRPERVHEVCWGGDPKQPVEFDVSGGVNPRKSFEAWKELRRGCSQQWSDLDVDYARHVGLILFNKQLTYLQQSMARTLHSSEQRKAMILNALPQLLLLVDAPGIILEQPRGRMAANLLQQGAGKGASLKEALPPWLSLYLEPVVNNFIQKGSQFRAFGEVLPPDGDTGPIISWQMLPISSGAALLILEDVTRERIASRQLQQAFRELKERDAIFDAISRHAPGAMFQYQLFTDGQSTIPFCTEKLGALLGVDVIKLHEDAAPLWKEIHPDDIERVHSELQKSKNELTVLETEHRRSHPAKGEIWVLVSATPLPQQDGSVIWNGYISDITESKNIQKRMLLEGRRETIERLAGGIAHDFNNYLSSVLNAAMLLETANDVGSRQHELLQMIVEETKSAQGLSRQMLAISKEQPLSVVAVPVARLLHETARFSTVGSKVNVGVQVDPMDLAVMADRGQLEQILSNLILNARQAMNEQGSIILEASRHVSFNGGKNEVCITVGDSGSGISDKLLSHIFEPFYTTKEGGSGLGLYVAQSLVKRMGGRIEVQSNQGLGTTFSVYLPAATSADVTSTNIGQTTKKDESPEALNLAKTVLMLEDNEVLLELTQEALQASGMKCKGFTRGAQLLDWLHNNERVVIDACVLDLTLPGGIGGLEVLPEILRLWPDCDIILTSGYTDADSELWNTYASKVTFLAKPYATTDLVRLLQLKRVR